MPVAPDNNEELPGYNLTLHLSYALDMSAVKKPKILLRPLTQLSLFCLLCGFLGCICTCKKHT